ncbi:hypothetical protein ACVW1A_008253 [Bradyrhizobium sp. LB1.3]|uniref:hypothetical protein n=1 Tax=unclassified Bradyrhizobium TaxID=2631580 RepID=UPI003391A2ED
MYYGSDRAGGWQRLDRPLRTLTTLDRFGLVQWIDGQTTLRMLQIPELKRAMGLTHLKDENGEGVKFLLDHGTRRDKVKVIGNGVCAPVMRAVVGSLLGGSSHDVMAEDLVSPKSTRTSRCLSRALTEKEKALAALQSGKQAARAASAARSLAL